MSKLSPQTRDIYESNARCLERAGMHGAANRYWKALDENKIIRPSWPAPHLKSYATDVGEDFRRRIAELIGKTPMTIPELSQILGLSHSGVAHHTALMRRHKQIHKVGETVHRHPVWGLA